MLGLIGYSYIWVEQFLIKELKPAQFVVIDNAELHKAIKKKDLI